MTMDSQLSTTLADSINNTHRECMGCDGELKEILLLKINKARECGIFLMEAKDKAGHGKWEDWVKVNISFDVRMAQFYMKFAKANPKPVTHLEDGIASVKDAMIASGTIAPPQGHKSQLRHSNPNPFQSFVSLTSDIQGAFRKWQEQAPIDEWSDELKSQVKGQLEPLVKIYEQL